MSSKNNLYYTLQGYHKEVTGSSIVCTIHFPNNTERKLLIDFGLFQENEYEDLNKDISFNINEIDAILVTHSHLDHIGRLPLISKKGYNKPIYSTFLTKLISSSILRNSAKVFQSNYDKERKFSKDVDIPLYDLDDVDNVLSLFTTCNYNEKINFDDNISITFFDNGHILSAACILLEVTYKQRTPLRILFTGDYKGNNTFKDVTSIPQEIFDLPISIVTESTLCDDVNISYEKSFQSDIISCIENGKGVLIPCLAQERFEEVLYELKKIEKLGYSLDICVDAPLATEINSIYSRYSNINYMPSNVIFINSWEEREIIFNSPKKRILIVSSGMGDYGMAPLYFNNFLSRDDYEILFTSYLSNYSLGRRIMELKRFNKIRIPGFKDSIKKVAVTKQTREFSSHVHFDNLVEFINNFKHVQNVIINHGCFNAQESLRQKLEQNNINAIILGTDKFHKVLPSGEISTFEIISEEKKSETVKPSKKSSLDNRTIPCFIRSNGIVRDYKAV